MISSYRIATRYSKMNPFPNQTACKRKSTLTLHANLLVVIAQISLIITGTEALSLHDASLKERKIPPPSLALTPRRHTSDFTARKNHPTSYDSIPKFKGPLKLSRTFSTSNHRIRIQKFYNESSLFPDDSSSNLSLSLPSSSSHRHPLKPSAKTDLILKTIMDHFASHDAPVDIKEMAESMEFYLRTRKRLLGIAKKRVNQKQHSKEATDDTKGSTTIIKVYDMCAGHGLTGMLFAACNPPKLDGNNRIIVQTHLVDKEEPPSHIVLKELIADICPWIKDNIHFHTCTLEALDNPTNVHINNDKMNDSSPTSQANADADKDECSIVIATHACGKLTDQVLNKAVNIRACAIAAMPCCYTGTDQGVAYGIRRALGVAWAADIKRTQYLADNDYHVDYATIPVEITPLNRIIMAEERL